MPAVQNMSIKPLENNPLASKIFSKKDKLWLDVIPVSNQDLCTRKDCAYIVMTTSSNNKTYLLDAVYKGEVIGKARLTNQASYLARIDNLSPKSYTRTGTALTELTCRLAVRSGHTSVGLFSLDSPIPFHFKMGARFPDSFSNDAAKAFINRKKSLLSRIGLEVETMPLVLGEMQIDLKQKSSGPESPHLMHTILKDDVEALRLTLQQEKH